MTTSISLELSATAIRSTYNKVMCRSRFLPLVALILTSAAVNAQSTSSTNPNQDASLRNFVQRAVQFLDSAQLQQRQQAEKALIDRGPKVLDLLPTDLEPYSSEVRTRLDRIRQKLYEDVAIQTASGSLVSLTGTFRLHDVLQELEQQTGNLIVTSREFGNTLELDLEKVPFHQALDQILDQSGLEPEPYFAPHPNQILIKPALAGAVARTNQADYTGPFRIAVVKVNSSKDLRIPNASACTLTLHVGWEPRVRPLYLTMTAEKLKAVDDTGNEITPLIDGEKTLNVEGTAPLVELEIPFSLPRTTARQLQTVTGTISAMVPGRKEHFEFSKLEASSSFPKQQRRAGVTVTVQSVRQTDQQTIVELDIHYRDAGNAFESHRGWTNRNLVYLTRDGNKLALKPRRETIAQNKQAVTYRYTFDTQAELARMTFNYHTPALLLNKEVEFELNAIPLP